MVPVDRPTFLGIEALDVHLPGVHPNREEVLLLAVPATVERKVRGLVPDRPTQTLHGHREASLLPQLPHRAIGRRLTVV